MPPLVRSAALICWGLVAVVGFGCGPRSTTHRRVVHGLADQPVGDAPPVQAELELGWATGARNFQALDPMGSPRVAWRVDMGTPLVHPLMTDGQAVCGTAQGDAYCVKADGSFRWRVPVDAVGGLAVRASGVAIPTTAEMVVEVDLSRGSTSRTHLAKGIVQGHPLPLQGELVWVTRNGEVVADTGWSAPSSDSAIGAPASDEEQVYFATGTGEVVAVSRARARWRTVLPGPVVGGLVASDGMVFAAYLGQLGRPGGVAAIASDSGAVAWRTPLSNDPASGPALGRVLVVPDRGGEVVGLDVATGSVLWRTEVAGAASTTPAFGAFGLYFGNADGRLHRLDPDDGGEVWSLDLGATPSADPVVLSGHVVVGLSDGSLVAVGGQ